MENIKTFNIKCLTPDQINILELYQHYTKKCYQCNKDVNWLNSDSRCKDCTQLTTEETKGE
jgi:hypothetical protein